MLKDNKKNLWSAFSRYIITYAAQREDFILLATEGAMKSSLVKELPSDKVFSPMPADRDIVLAAAGLAVSGKRPWIISESADILIESYSDIRNVLSTSALPVSIAVANAGLSVPDAGAEHNILEDVSLMGTVPDMVVLVPSTPGFFDEKNSVLCSYQGPIYMRLSTELIADEHETVSSDEHHGGSRIVSTGSDVTICTCGDMVQEALEAVAVLEKRGITPEIIDCYRIKPFSEQILLSSVRKTGCCVVAEEHSINGGLFSAVTTSLSQTYPVPVRCVAVRGQIAAAEKSEEVKEYYGLTWKDIVNAVMQVYALRRG